MASLLAVYVEIKDMGHVQSCLDIQFTQDLAKHQVFLSRTNYTKELLRRFSIDNCKPARTPVEANLKLEEFVSLDDKVREDTYPNLIGALMYLSVMPHPDISCCKLFKPI